MGRHGDKTKTAIRLSVNLPPDLRKQFLQYCEEKGQTQTMAMERILRKFFSDKKEWTDKY